jgi:hypothetical protein
VAVGEFCKDCGTQKFRRNIACPDGRSGCITLHYELYCPRCEGLAKLDADAKLERLILRKFREELHVCEPQVHLAGCEQTRAKHVSGQDSTCGEGTCEIARLEAVVKCLHGYR